MGIYIYIYILGDTGIHRKTGFQWGVLSQIGILTILTIVRDAVGKTRSKPESQLSIHWVYPSLLGVFFPIARAISH